MAEVTININFGEFEAELSIEEAAELYEQLDAIFGEVVVCDECGFEIDECECDDELVIEEPEICIDCEDKAECPAYQLIVFGEPVGEYE